MPRRVRGKKPNEFHSHLAPQSAFPYTEQASCPWNSTHLLFFYLPTKCQVPHRVLGIISGRQGSYCFLGASTHLANSLRDKKFFHIAKINPFILLNNHLLLRGICVPSPVQGLRDPKMNEMSSWPSRNQVQKCTENPCVHHAGGSMGDQRADTSPGDI